MTSKSFKAYLHFLALRMNFCEEKDKVYEIWAIA